MDRLEAISPIDGRYRNKVLSLEEIFSEKALASYRVFVEGEYLMALSELGQTGLRKFTRNEKDLIGNLYHLNIDDAKLIKDIETKGYGNEIKATNHDVKAVEYYIKYKLKKTTLADSLEWIHFGLTSEDINNISYGLMLSDSLEEVMLPNLNKLYFQINNLGNTYRDTPILARTHGQAASPTTFGKEFKVFSSRVKRQIDKIESQDLQVKLNGATGNYNAHQLAYPDIDWIKFSSDFVDKLNFERKILLSNNFLTTQIEPHDSYVELFDSFKRLNNILIGFSQDMWRYISDGYLKQKSVAGEVGSSTMPHKVNPIDFENAEGNLAIANSNFEFFGRKLQVSRLQRDLSDSTVQRNYGVAFSHSLIAYTSLLNGLEKISVDKEKVSYELNSHPEVITEGIQTVLRAEGVKLPYEKLKELSRGQNITLPDIYAFVDSLEISEPVKLKLKSLTPENYIGLAKELAKDY